jgi:hypothetical protein
MKNFIFLLLLSFLFSNQFVVSQCVFGDCENSFSIKKYTDSTKFEGLFNQGKKVCGVNYYTSGAVYKGNFLDNKRNGEGMYLFANQDTFQGIYKADAKFYGTYKFKNGSSFEGFFVNDKQEGHGNYKDVQGDIWECEWKNGEIISKHKLKINKDSSAIFNAKSQVVPKEKSAKNSIPRMFAVVVGISNYLGGNNLKYADDDASLIYRNMNSAFSNELKEGSITLLLNEKASVYNIKNALQTILNKANENDYIVFYFSGHGSPGAFRAYDDFLQHKDVKDIFVNSKAKYKLCVADACFSGSISNTQIVSNYAELHHDRICVLMSSKSNQTSIEFSGINQGVFSYYFVKGMHGKADLNQDKYVTVGELFIYVKKMVSIDTKNQQIPVVYGNDLYKIPLSRIK